MNGFQKTTLTGYQTVQAHLSTMVETADMLPVAMSVDSDFFSRIYDVAFGEKGNKDLEAETRKDNLVAAKREEDSQDLIQNVIEDVMNEMQEKRLEKMHMQGDMYVFGDYRFELEDAQENLRDKGVDHYTKDMSEEDTAEFALISARILDGTASPEDIARAGELSSDFVKDSDHTFNDKENKLSNMATATEAEITHTDDVFSRIQGSSFDSAFDAPTSQITDTFAMEVAGTGANAQSLMPSVEKSIDIAEPEVSVAQQVPVDKGFVLDTLG